MKKKEKADMMAKKRSVNASERISDVPKMKFIAKMKMATKRPPFIDRIHLLPVFASNMRGIWTKKITINGKTFVNMSDAVKRPKVTMNFARGSIL
jgi:hypothetical protein